MPGVNPVRVTTNPQSVRPLRVLDHLLISRPDLRTNQDLVDYLYRMGDGSWEATERAALRLGVDLSSLADNPHALLSRPEGVPEPQGFTGETVALPNAASFYAAARLKLFEHHPRLRTNQDLVSHFLDGGRRDWAEASKLAANHGYSLHDLVATRDEVAQGRPPLPPAGTPVNDDPDAFAAAPTRTLTSPHVPGERAADIPTAPTPSITPVPVWASAPVSPKERLLSEHPEFETNQDLVNHFLDSGRRSWELGEALAERYGYRLGELVRNRGERIPGRGESSAAFLARAASEETRRTRLNGTMAALRRIYDGAERVKVVRNARRVVAFQFDAKLSVCTSGAGNVTCKREVAEDDPFIMYDPNFRRHTALRFTGDISVDADLIPYVALPPSLVSLTGVRKGDLVCVEHRGRRCFAIYADVGPEGELGRGSMFLARKLGLDDDPCEGGVKGTQVRYTVLPGSGRVHGIKSGAAPVTPDDIEEAGSASFEAAREEGFIR